MGEVERVWGGILVYFGVNFHDFRGVLGDSEGIWGGTLGLLLLPPPQKLWVLDGARLLRDNVEWGKIGNLRGLGGFYGNLEGFYGILGGVSPQGIEGRQTLHLSLTWERLRCPRFCPHGEMDPEGDSGGGDSLSLSETHGKLKTMMIKIIIAKNH